MKLPYFFPLLAGGAAAPPVAIAAQAQGRTLPVIGFLGPQSRDPNFLAKFHQGLNELGYTEGRNVGIEYQWVSDQGQQLSALAARLVQRRVALIVTTGGLAAARAAKEATST